MRSSVSDCAAGNSATFSGMRFEVRGQASPVFARIRENRAGFPSVPRHRRDRRRASTGEPARAARCGRGREASRRRARRCNGGVPKRARGGDQAAALTRRDRRRRDRCDVCYLSSGWLRVRMRRRWCVGWRRSFLAIAKAVPEFARPQQQAREDPFDCGEEPEVARSPRPLRTKLK